MSEQLCPASKGNRRHSRRSASHFAVQPEYVDRLLEAPDEHHAPTGANLLWQLAVLELWLQAQLP
jgi:asparagine synthase (glutamine-hydrolysing)